VQYGRRDSPWFTDEAWMWKKTALKQLLKLAPLSVEIQRATGLDDAADAGLPQDLALLADPNAEATALFEGDGPEEDTTGQDVIEMPQRISSQATSAASSAPAQTTDNNKIIDRITDAGPAGNGWAAFTQAGLRLWTRDLDLGKKLLEAKGQLRQIGADPADAQGRRRLTTLQA
jgi:hypothetical protein